MKHRNSDGWALVGSRGFFVAMAIVTLTACGPGGGSTVSSTEFPTDKSGLAADSSQVDPEVAETSVVQPVNEAKGLKPVESSDGQDPRLVSLKSIGTTSPVVVQLGNLSDEVPRKAREAEKNENVGTISRLEKPTNAIKRKVALGAPRKILWEASSGDGAGASWQWQTQSDGSQLAVLQIATGNAVGVRVGFVLYRVPNEAVLTVAAPSAAQGFRWNGDELNAVLNVNMTAQGDTAAAREFWAPAVDGAQVEIRVALPRGVAPSDWDVSIERISHLWSKATSLPAGGYSASCNVDAPCVNPQPWVVDAVALIEFVENAETFYCTGTLLADTAGSKIPYFLTAEHCVDSQAVASTVTSHWFNRSASCGSAQLKSNATTLTGGARLLYSLNWATESDTSFLLLNNQPPVGVAYAGWNTFPAGTSNTMGLHHPRGDRLKASSGLSSSNPQDPTFLNTYWNTGITEGGSSGSGLFNSSNQLVGQLYGGYSSCEFPNSPDLYGRFDYAYNQGMQDWLNVKRQKLVEIKTRSLGDYNGDGKADLLWRSSGGLVNIAFMNGGAASSWKHLNQFNANVKIMGAGDFNGDGYDDIVWRNMASGAVSISLMSAAGAVSNWLPVGQTPIALNVALEGIGDFDGNGRADMLWRNTNTGRSVMSYHNADGSVASWPVVSNYIDPVHTAAQRVGDINGDGKDDIVWRNTASGNVVLSLMDGNMPTWVSITASPIPLGTVIEAVADFDGNGKADILWRNMSTGRSLMSFHNTDGSVASWPVVSNNIPTYVSTLGAGDFDGDGKADIVWRNMTTGNTVISLMNGAIPTWVTMPL